MQALAVDYPSIRRTNEYWKRHHPEMIAEVASKGAGKVWSGPKDPLGPSALFDTMMAPYLDDPFRGTRDRRVLGPGEHGIDLEARSIERALEAAKLGPHDVDLLISVGFQPTTIGVGNGVYLADRLGLRCPAINLETCCSGALVAFQTACALISAEQYERVMVSVSCTYSIQCEPENGLSLTSGDGGAAFLVGPTEPGTGLLGGKTLNTSITCGTMYFEGVVDGEDQEPRVRLGASRTGGKVLRESALPLIRKTTQGALESAGVALSDIDFFVFNTPTAWYRDFCCRALEIDEERTIDTYPLYANTGPALTTGNLFHALAEDRIAPGDLVLVYAVGSISTVSAAVVRWGETALGPMPAAPESVQ
jgi:3-oxoacyl-[acyl-carrier-protein] synthase-3